MGFHKLCVLGLGYIGLPTASTFATHGLKVVGVDVNSNVVSGLQNGKIHIHEPGLRTLVQAAFHSGNLVVEQQPSEADAFIISVPTPFDDEKRADLSYVISATESIVPCLRKGNLVILESTSPPRTTVDVVAPILEKSGLKAGKDFLLAYSPERVLPGQILRELIENARVIGGINQESAEAGRDLYATFIRGDIILTDATTAEMVKLMENTYRDVNIAIANEFSRLAARYRVDIWEAVQIANLHPRVSILNPGPGVGGHCISVDPWFFVESAPDITQLIKTAREVNDSQPGFVVEWVKQILGESIENKQIAVLGLTYKADVDDIRESPAIEVARLLKEAGLRIVIYEPYKPSLSIEGTRHATSLEDAVGEADAVLLLVGHEQFRKITPQEMARMSKARIILDVVNAWDPQLWENQHYSLYRLGVGKNSEE